jgi:hypothetical protein
VLTSSPVGGGGGDGGGWDDLRSMKVVRGRQQPRWLCRAEKAVQELSRRVMSGEENKNK